VWRPGDNLWVASVIALRPKTGELVWHYQWTPAETYDFDGNNENVLADLVVDGTKRKVLMHADRNGFLYVLDRTNGKVIAANPFVKVNWAEKIDLKTGKPVLTDLLDRAIKGEQVNVFPSRGTNATLIAFNPKKNLVYLNSWNLPRLMKFVDNELVMGAGYTGIESTSTVPKGEPGGYHVALEPLTGKAVWKTPLEAMGSSAGMLATDGGLLFTGLISGEFIALDQDTGKQLWQFKTGSSVNAPPITSPDQGKQYVSVQSGRGGSVAGRFTTNRIPAGGSVWTFAVRDVPVRTCRMSKTESGCFA
jgi:alcohol dehydrogenase (cytochrome c)